MPFKQKVKRRYEITYYWNKYHTYVRNTVRKKVLTDPVSFNEAKQIAIKEFYKLSNKSVYWIIKKVGETDG